MKENEMEQFFRYVVMKECSANIRLKCNFISRHGVDDNSIRDLNELINQFLALRKIQDAFPLDEVVIRKQCLSY